MAETLTRLGIIGMSPGNGHPYSWSAICNGYDAERMATCPFPVIPKYLSEQVWPDSQIGNVKVSHLWTQDKNLSEHIAEACLIPNVVNEFVEMIGDVDGILLARDDSENHQHFATPFIEAGLPVFIDKPLATSLSDAQNLLASQKFEHQIFSCSALRYSTSFTPNTMKLEDVRSIRACIPKKWRTYAVHIIEPIVAHYHHRGYLESIERTKPVNPIGNSILVKWKNLSATFETTQSDHGTFEIIFSDGNRIETKNSIDSFSAFKSAILSFLSGIENKRVTIPRSETLEIVKIIEHGC